MFGTTRHDVWNLDAVVLEKSCSMSFRWLLDGLFGMLHERTVPNASQ